MFFKMNRKVLFLFFISFSIFVFLQGINSCKIAKVQNESIDKIKLGRYLFYDRRLSVNNTRSCGTCHNPQFAFTDGYKRSLGAFADVHQRNTQPLFNLTYLKYFTAADSTLHSPLQQMNNPLFNEHPVEMGAKGVEEKILKTIQDDHLYQQLFSSTKQKVSWENIKSSISEFALSLQSFSSPYDNFIKGDSNALNISEKIGLNLFFSSQLKCANCHGGINFSSPSITDANTDTSYYFNTGLYNIDGKNAYPAYDMGLYQFTKNESDIGKFRVPTLRNLLFTAPYFHDGSEASLNAVINIYASGGRNITTGIYKGNGIKNKYKHPFINGFTISEKNKIDLINFLYSLSDSTFINNPNYKNPFAEDETKKNINLQ
jgi:cytochrome c peroxidase